MASLEGKPSHKLLTRSMEALTCMTHRGGIAADKKSGDGCGLLLQKPDSFFRAESQRLWQHSLAQTYIVGMFFLSKGECATQKEAIEKHLESKWSIIGWREVPTDSSCLGPIAHSCAPESWQLICEPKKPLSPQEIKSNLFVSRCAIERQLAESENFYICSLSDDLVGYKGLLMPQDLDKFYLDLQSEALKTSIVVFHQRFSTNTLPSWALAQPFRMLAHNGEINTISGNRNWVHAREHVSRSPLLSEPMIESILDATKSDSCSLDAMLDFLVSGGLDIHHAIRILVPPAWQNSDLDEDVRSFYRYFSLHMEPWDGPAGLVLTDGRYAICALDRNGLRPSRWVLTKDKIITAAPKSVCGLIKKVMFYRKGVLDPAICFLLTQRQGL